MSEFFEKTPDALEEGTQELGEEDMEFIRMVVKRVVQEYGPVLEALGRGETKLTRRRSDIPPNRHRTQATEPI